MTRQDKFFDLAVVIFILGFMVLAVMWMYDIDRRERVRRANEPLDKIQLSE